MARWSPHPVQVIGVAQQSPGTGAARVDEDVPVRGVVTRVVRAEGEALGAGDRLAVHRQAGDVPTVLGVLLRPVRQHLPGTDGVQLLDAVEEEQPDVASCVTPAGSGAGVGG